MKKILFLFLLAFLLFPPIALAASLSITNAPSVVDQFQEFEIDVSLSCSGCGDSFLRGVFYPSGTNYFGYTYDNSGNWSNASGSNCTTFFKVAQSDLEGGAWNGKIKVKTDIDSSYYKGPDEYFFKVGRYTSSCGSPIWSSEATLIITGPSPTPTLVPTITALSTPTNSPTPTRTSTPTKTPSPTPISKPTATPKVTQAPSPTPTVPKMAVQESFEEEKEDVGPTSILGEMVSASPSAVPTEIVPKPEESFFNFPKLAIGLGFIFLAVSGILAFRSYKKSQEDDYR